LKNTVSSSNINAHCYNLSETYTLIREVPYLTYQIVTKQKDSNTNRRHFWS